MDYTSALMDGIATQPGINIGSSQPTNLVTNGDFSTGDLTGWIDSNSYWSVVSGKAFHTGGSTFNTLLTTGIPAVGATMRLRFEISGFSSAPSDADSGVRVQFRTSANGPVTGPLYGFGQTNGAAVNGSYDITVTVPAASFYLGFARNQIGDVTTFSVDNVIVNEI